MSGQKSSRPEIYEEDRKASAFYVSGMRDGVAFPKKSVALGKVVAREKRDSYRTGLGSRVVGQVFEF